MKDPRIEKLASNLLNYSVELKENEKVYIEFKGLDTFPLVRELLFQIKNRGAIPFWFYSDESLLRQVIKEGSEKSFKALGQLHKEIMEKCQAFIGIRGSENPFDLSDIDSDTMDLYTKHFVKPVHFDTRVVNTKWVVLRYPNNSMAQLAQKPQEVFEDFYFEVCNLDYSKFSRAAEPLKELMDKTEEVLIKGPGTEISFSIKNMKSVKCDGKKNIPDGEIYTSPVRESLNGRLTFNCPSFYKGILFEGIELIFKNGKVVESKSSNPVEFNKILDIDEGARFTGEFALGLNPKINIPMKDTLFDEKIFGSFHFALGNSYKDETFNGNTSAIHWDLVSIQTKEYGGGEIYFDGKLIRKDGLFTLDNLNALSDKKYW